jgi:hypothetical protein
LQRVFFHTQAVKEHLLRSWLRYNQRNARKMALSGVGTKPGSYGVFEVRIYYEDTDHSGVVYHVGDCKHLDKNRC